MCKQVVYALTYLELFSDAGGEPGTNAEELRNELQCLLLYACAALMAYLTRALDGASPVDGTTGEVVGRLKYGLMACF